MLYLIQINSYNSVSAPPKRGFSTIEIWFVGMQAPILLATLEYGCILAMKKFWPQQKVGGLELQVAKYQKQSSFFWLIISKNYQGVTKKMFNKIYKFSGLLFAEMIRLK